MDREGRGHHGDIHKFIRNAVKAIRDQNQRNQISGKVGMDRGGILTDSVIDSLDYELDTLLVSEREIELNVVGILNDIANNNNNNDTPVDSFFQRWDNFCQSVQTRDTESHEIAFPLNIKYTGISDMPESFEAEGISFVQIPHVSWKNKYESVAVEESQELTQWKGMKQFEFFMKRLPEENPFSLRHTYWKAEIETSDPRYAIDRVATSLRTLLGLMNFAIHYGRRETEDRSWSINNMWQSGWSDLRIPPTYIHFVDEEYYTFYTTSDLSPRDPVKMTKSKREPFEELIADLPAFSSEDKADPALVQSYGLFQSGITDPSHKQSFLSYWRALEILVTGIKENCESKTTIDRSLAFTYSDIPSLMSDRSEQLANKRNQLVHEGKGYRISKKDTNFLKQLLDNVLYLLTIEGKDRPVE